MTLQDIKTNFIVDVATELFLNNSISEITIKDIAIKAGVGEATIYRYFSKKQNIVLHSILKLTSLVFNNYFDLSAGKNGFEKIALFYNNYLKIFEEHPNFYKFIAEFDAYMISEEQIELNEYESEINKFNDIFYNAYNLGLIDGSIKKQENIQLFYFSSTHALIELCKKLAVKNGILSQDKLIDKSSEIKALIEIFLFSLKNL